MVLYSDNTVALYNGVPVVQVPFMGENAFSFYFIFVGEDVKDPTVLLHEHGHALHFRQIGPAKYLAYVALPSMLGFRDGPIFFEEYYSQLWEHIADILGGVIRTKNGLPYPYETSSKDAVIYWIWTYFS